MSELTAHPIADIFPLMDDSAYELFKLDVKMHGLREPTIWLYEGQILDGRHRYRVCQELNIPFVTKEYNSDDPIGFVVSLNIHRRHLNESQRAMVAARIEGMTHGGSRQDANLHLDRAQASGMVNVSPRAVADAKKIQHAAEPEIVQVVDAGLLRVSQAAKVADAEPDVQQQVADLAQHGDIKQARRIIQEVHERTHPRTNRKSTHTRKSTVNGAPHPASQSIEAADLFTGPEKTSVDLHADDHEFHLEADPPEDGFEWDNTLDTMEDVIENFGVILDGIRERGGIREFFRQWPEHQKHQFIEKAERYVSQISQFITEAKQEFHTIMVEG